MSIPVLNTALYSKLGGTATSAGSAVFYLQAPDNQALPFIVFDYAGDRDENLDANRTKDALLSIRAYAATPGAAGTIDGQIDTLLHLAPLTVTGWTNFWIARENAYSLVETDPSGRKTYMSGADYRIRLDKS
jgi:hypothetical protein